MNKLDELIEWYKSECMDGMTPPNVVLDKMMEIRHRKHDIHNTCVFVRSKEDFDDVIAVLEKHNQPYDKNEEFNMSTMNDHFYFYIGHWHYYNGSLGMSPSEQPITVQELDEILSR